jgi:hypothetical protein
MNISFEKIETLIPEENHKLAFKFFLVFSRFEYALKRAGFANGSARGVEAAWDMFSSKYRSAFKPDQTAELLNACEYFTKNPPRKQILDAGVLDWSEPQFRSEVPFFIWLLLMLRSVRNNFFHGGKFPIAPIEEPGRNLDLLRHSFVIIQACLALDKTVAHEFFEI